MKKILFVIIIGFIIIIIGTRVKYNSDISLYFGNTNNSYKYKYDYFDTRVIDIINAIDNNIIINSKTIQNILVKSNVIYLDLNGIYISKDFIYDIEKLLIKIRYFTKEKLIIILRKENSFFDKNINKWIFEIKEKYDIIIKRWEKC